MMPTAATPTVARRLEILTVLLCIYVAIQAALARWVPPDAKLGVLAAWAVLLACAAVAAFIVGQFASERHRATVSSVAFFVVAFVLLVIGLVLECSVRPGGCDL